MCWWIGAIATRKRFWENGRQNEDEFCSCGWGIRKRVERRFRSAAKYTTERRNALNWFCFPQISSGARKLKLNSVKRMASEQRSYDDWECWLSATKTCRWPDAMTRFCWGFYERKSLTSTKLFGWQADDYSASANQRLSRSDFFSRCRNISEWNRSVRPCSECRRLRRCTICWRCKFNKRCQRVTRARAWYTCTASVSVCTDQSVDQVRYFSFFSRENCDPYKCPVEMVFRSNILALENAVRDPRTQIGGLTIVVDMDGVSFAHAKFLSPHLAKRTVEVVQECFPLRFKAFHILYQPFYFDAVLAILRPFLKEKIRSRVRTSACQSVVINAYPFQIITHGNKLSSLHRYIPKSVLPSDYGGEQGPFDNSKWRDQIIRDEHYFLRLETYVFNAQKPWLNKADYSSSMWVRLIGST